MATRFTIAAAMMAVAGAVAVPIVTRTAETETAAFPDARPTPPGTGATPALPAPPVTVHLRGTVADTDRASLTLETREGRTVSVGLDQTVGIDVVRPFGIAAIVPGSVVGTAAVPQADGSYRAMEVHVLPEGARGLPDGVTDWDLRPDAKMINATVAALVSAQTGRTLKLTYKGGSATVSVPSSTPVVTFDAGSRAELKNGAPAFIVAHKADDGALVATRILVGRDGVAPPM